MHRLFRRAGWVHAGVLALYCALTVLLTWPLAQNLTSAIPGDGFDGWQNYWNLWWMKTALVERLQSPLVTDLLYYPTGVSLYFHTLNPFNGLISLPVQLAGGLLLAYNFVVFFSFVVSGYGAFLLALWLLRRMQITPAARYGAAFTAGAIFTFAPFHFAHLLGHMQVFAYQWIPFTVLYLLRAMNAAARVDLPARRWVREALFAGFFMALAALCDWYFALYLALFVGVAVLWQWIRGARLLGWFTALWRAMLPAAATGMVAVVLLLPMMLPMLREAISYDFMVRPISDLYILSATAFDFIMPNRLHALAPEDGFTTLGNTIAPISERTLAIGWMALALAVVGLLRDRKRALPWLLAALFFVLLAMGPRPQLYTLWWDDVPATAAQVQGEWSLYSLLNEIIPFMRISRSVSRFALMVQLCVAMAAAVGLATLLRGASRKWTPVLAALASIVVVAEAWGVPYPLSPPDTPAYYETLAAPAPAPRVTDAPNFNALAGEVAPGAMLNLPMNYDRPGYLLYQTIHGMPLGVAYISRDDPRTLTERVPVLQQLRHLGDDIVAADLGEVGATVLHDLGVSIVTLDRYKMPGGREREYTEAVAAEIFGDQTPLHADERLTAYAVHAPDILAPYIVLGFENWGALQQDSEGEPIGRVLGEGDAPLQLRHVGETTRLVIRYRSDTPLLVRAADGTLLNELPATPAASVDFPIDSAGELRLHAPGATIERLTLIVEE